MYDTIYYDLLKEQKKEKKKKRCISYIFIMDQKTGVKGNILIYDFLAFWYEKIMNGSGTERSSFGLDPDPNFLILRSD